MSTPNGLKGIQADAYAPYQTDPASAPGTVQTAFLDPSNFVDIRGPVLTDEGGFREMFSVNPFTAPGTDWTQVLGSGSISVVAGVCTITGSVVASDRTYVSIPVDFMPLSFSFELDEIAGRVIAANSQDFFFGMYSDPDPNIAVASGEFVEELWLGSGSNTSGTFRSGAGGNLQTTTHTITGRTTVGFRTINIDGESCFLRDNSVNLPTTTTRATHSVKMPGTTTELFLCIGFRNRAAVATPAWSVAIRTIFVKNTNRLVVNTGFL